MVVILDGKSPLGKLILTKVYQMGKNQKWLASECNIQPSHLSFICNGKIKCPDVKLLRKLSTILDISMSELFQAISQNYDE